MNRRRLITIFLWMLGLTTAFGAIYIFDTINQEKFKTEAKKVGLVRAKQECTKEELAQKVCDSMTVGVSLSECNARPCWIVSARASDPSDFIAGVTVQKMDGEYKIIDYQRARSFR